MSRVVLYSFWGRRENIELQLPYIRRILAENPDAEFHAFNLARERTDYFYLTQCLPTAPRFTVHHEYFHTRPHWLGYHEVYRHFSAPEYKGAVFIKLDDDIVFMQTERLPDLAKAVRALPGTIISANVINNGACAVHQAGLSERFEATGIRWLDWHLHAAMAAMAHQHFFQHGPALLRQRPKVIPTEDWVSINMIGYDWPVGVQLAELVGTPSPALIAGRGFRPELDRLGDEGAANMLPRAILRGFVAAHLTFGPQNVREPDAVAWREAYQRISDAVASGGAWPPAAPAKPFFVPRKDPVARYEITQPCKYADENGIPVFHEEAGAIVELTPQAALLLGARVRPVQPQPVMIPQLRAPRKARKTQPEKSPRVRPPERLQERRPTKSALSHGAANPDGRSNHQ